MSYLPSYNMSAHDVALCMLSGSFVEFHEIRFDQLIRAILDEIPRQAVTISLHPIENMHPLFYKDIVAEITRSRRDIAVCYRIVLRSNMKKSKRRRKCRQILLARAEYDIMSDYKFEHAHARDFEQDVCMDIDDLVHEYGFTREQLIDWYIRYLIRADALRTSVYPKDQGNGGAYAFGLTPDEIALIQASYIYASNANSKVHLRKGACRDINCRHRRLSINDNIDDIERLQYNDVASAIVHRALDADMIPDLRNMVESYMF